MLITAEALRAESASPALRGALAAAAASTVALEVAGQPCAVHFDDPRAARAFARRYADLHTTRAPVMRSYAIAGAPGGALFWTDAGAAYRWPHGELSSKAIAFLADAVAVTSFFRAHRDALSFHAAAVGVDGAVAALAGDTHAGKTTTTVACVRRGMAFYTDERCVLSGGRVVPFPRALSIRAGGAALLRAEREDDALGALLRSRGGEGCEDLCVSALFAGWTPPPPAPLRAVFLIAGTASTPALLPATRTDVLRTAGRFVHCPGDGLDAAARLLAALTGVACHRLVLGSPGDTARLVADTLRRCAEDVPASA